MFSQNSTYSTNYSSLYRAYQPALRDGGVPDERGQQAGGLLHRHAAPLARHGARRAVRHARRQRREPTVHLVTLNTL